MEEGFRQVFVKFLKFVSLAIAALYVAATVVVVLVLRQPIWHQHLLPFIGQTWAVFVAEKIGSTSPGFLNSIVVSVVGFILTFIAIGCFQGRAAMSKHLIETIAMGLVGLATVLLLVYGTQFAWEIAKAGYADHEQLTARANALKTTCPTCPDCPPLKTRIISSPPVVKLVTPTPLSNPEFAAGCKVAERQFPGEMYIARRDPQVRNVTLLLNGVSSLLTDKLTVYEVPSCHLRITAPKDTDEIAKTFRELASSIRCRVDYQPSDDLSPEIEKEALDGAEDNIVTIHAPKGDERYERFIGRMNLIVHVKRSYDLYHAGKADQAMWVQIGHGFPWHVENTYVTRMGGQ
jgi:hypothetical protein